MSRPVRLTLLPALAALFFLAGCASPDPVPYRDLASSGYLRTNPADDGGREPYSYTSAVNWSNYSFAIMAPVEIYKGADNQFGDMSSKDKGVLAEYLYSRFSEKLASRFRMTREVALASSPGMPALRIKVTLTGASTNTPVLSTLTRFDIAGGLYNGVQAIRGREGMLTGSVLYAVEIYDARQNRLLKAFIAKQYPGVYDLGAGIGSLSAAKAGIDNGADDLLEQLTD
jgi:hypothetical protein